MMLKDKVYNLYNHANDISGRILGVGLAEKLFLSQLNIYCYSSNIFVGLTEGFFDARISRKLFNFAPQNPFVSDSPNSLGANAAATISEIQIFANIATSVGDNVLSVHRHSLEEKIFKKFAYDVIKTPFVGFSSYFMNRAGYSVGYGLGLAEDLVEKFL